MMTITEGSNVITMKFYYDEIGTPIMFDYNGTLYYCEAKPNNITLCEAKNITHKNAEKRELYGIVLPYYSLFCFYCKFRIC